METLYPIFDRMVGRDEKERRLGQKARVIWLYGLSGSGKSTLACSLERKLLDEGFAVHLLDGDNVRSGLNRGLGFSDEDRRENIRRVAEVAKLFLQAGIVTLSAFITPTNVLRRQVREIVGDDDLIEVFVDCPWEVCQERDVKGLYARAAAGEVEQFTGRDSAFEAPEHPDLVLATGRESPEESLRRLHETVLPRIRRAGPAQSGES